MFGIAVLSSSVTGFSDDRRVAEVAVQQVDDVDAELRELALVVAALVDDRRAARRACSRPRIRSLDGSPSVAEQEEVEDDDRGERRERDQDPPCDEPPAHSSVHSSGSVLLRPLLMNEVPRIASEISTEPISTERGVVSQPSSVDVVVAAGAAEAVAGGGARA